MNITLNQLRAFERIVRLGSFRAAAEELRVTQPSVSQRIRELEAALETSLFLRRGPRVRLTAMRSAGWTRFRVTCAANQGTSGAA
mgnify:CR=1 FL=1